MKQEGPHYRDMLKQVFDQRRKRNGLYSLRAFARDIQISSGYLSQIFNKDRDLDLKKANQIAENIGWNEDLRILFIKSVISEKYPEVFWSKDDLT